MIDVELLEAERDAEQLDEVGGAEGRQLVEVEAELGHGSTSRPSSDAGHARRNAQHRHDCPGRADERLGAHVLRRPSCERLVDPRGPVADRRPAPGRRGCRALAPGAASPARHPRRRRRTLGEEPARSRTSVGQRVERTLAGPPPGRRRAGGCVGERRRRAPSDWQVLRSAMCTRAVGVDLDPVERPAHARSRAPPPGSRPRRRARSRRTCARVACRRARSRNRRTASLAADPLAALLPGRLEAELPPTPRRCGPRARRVGRQLARARRRRRARG